MKHRCHDGHLASFGFHLTSLIFQKFFQVRPDASNLWDCCTRFFYRLDAFMSCSQQCQSMWWSLCHNYVLCLLAELNRMQMITTDLMYWIFPASSAMTLLWDGRKGIWPVRNSLSVHFNGNFARWSWVSWYQNVSLWILLGLMEMVVTAGAIRHVKLRSNHYHQQTSTQLFTARCPCCCPTNVSKHWRLSFDILVVMMWLEHCLGVLVCSGVARILCRGGTGLGSWKDRK